MARRIVKPRELSKLRAKGSIALRVSRLGLPKNAKQQEAVIFITEMKLYGIDSQQLVIAIPGYGSTVVDIGNIRVQDLYKIGLSLNAAKLLKSTLDRLYID